MNHLENNQHDHPKNMDSILIEVTNIMTGTVLSDLSNQLHLDLAGGIPVLKKINQTKTFRLLDGADFPLCISTNYTAENEFFNPVFINLFESKLLTALQNKN
jgi:chemotaxis protein CheY-P-specific phosphatase CheC